MKVVRGVVHLEVGDVGVGVGDVAGDVGEQARVFVGFDFQRRRKEAFAFLRPGGADPFFVAVYAAQRAFLAVDVDADARHDLSDDGFLRQRAAALGEADAAFKGTVYFELAGGVVVLGGGDGFAVAFQQGGGDECRLAQSLADLGQEAFAGERAFLQVVLPACFADAVQGVSVAAQGVAEQALTKCLGVAAGEFFEVFVDGAARFGGDDEL